MMDDEKLLASFSHMYLHAYMKEKGWHETAETFKREAGVLGSGDITLLKNVESDMMKWWNYYLKQVPSPRIEIFTKVLSRSDCLKHLVVPRRSKVMDCLPNPKDSSNGIEILIENEGETYKFTYCYRQSNCTFIFCGQWKKFMARKGLKDGDIIILERNENQKYVMACKKGSR